MDLLIKWLEHQIDTIDEELVYLLYRRSEILKELKQTPEYTTSPSQRSQRSLDIMLEEAKDKWVDTKLVNDIHDVIENGYFPILREAQDYEIDAEVQSAYKKSLVSKNRVNI